jgi:glutamyl-tRNA reductase
MALLALGISFRRAPIDLLERLAFDQDDLAKVFRRAEELEAVDEAVVLSTCNRVEVYGAVASYHEGFLALKGLLTEARTVGERELADPLYAHWERDAAEHLFRVAGGLDSMVLGETQIQRQVRDALRIADREGAAGPELARLFHAAGRAGRRVRRETSVGAAPDAFVERAADRAADELGGLGGRDVVVIGAGTMAALAVRHLRGRRVGRIRILNRSVGHAAALADRTGSEHGGLDDVPAVLAEADLVVSATNAPGPVVRTRDVRPAARARPTPLVLLDLAVPRDVEPEAGEMPGVVVLDVEALRSPGDETGEAISRAHAIVEEEVRRFVVRRRGDELAPLIRAIRRRGDAVVEAELSRFAGRLRELSDEERAAVEALARGVAAKLLHDPIVALKERSEPGSGRSHARLLAELLGLDPDEG